MRQLNQIVVHCAASKGDVTAATIKRWHIERGFADIGYHYVIRRNGAIEIGRPIDKAGAHVRGHNSDSIGICLTGGYGGADDFTTDQLWSLRFLIDGLCLRWVIPKHAVFGHCDFPNVKKTCPNFDVAAWYRAIDE